MKKNILSLALCITVFSVSQPANAQNNWSLEIRGDGASTTREPAETDLGTGFGLEASLAYYFMPHLAVYGGWGWKNFTADRSWAGADADFEETGYRFGLQFNHPLGDTGINSLLSAGGIYSHIEVEDEHGTISADSGHRFGGEAGVGLVIGLGERLSLIPNVRYHYLPATITSNGQKQDADLGYLSYGLSLAWTF